MIKIFSTSQTREADQYTIEQEPVCSIDLMERAAMAFTSMFVSTYSAESSIHIFCGYGNNGGDGLAIARLLLQKSYPVTVYLLADSQNYSADLQINLSRFREIKSAAIHPIAAEDDFPIIEADAVIVDALFGSGLNRPLSGLAAALIRHLNTQQCIRVAVDIPSGLFADQWSAGEVFMAHHTITFQHPKLSFLFPENAAAVGRWATVPIGLHQHYIRTTATAHYLTEPQDIKKIINQRGKFDHKGTFGHAFIHAGSKQKMGAAILCGKACMRAGAGLTTLHASGTTAGIINTAIPEAMTMTYKVNSKQPFNWTGFSAAAFGPGTGTGQPATTMLLALLKGIVVPAVLDADALNIISMQKKSWKLLPDNSIITPHLREFERLAGHTRNWYERHQLQLQLSKQHSIFIVLKGAYTCITTPEGISYFNPTGNPGMAKGGSGDVLTGILAGLLAQRYDPLNACLLGVYLHGLAGDLAVKKQSVHSLLARDIIDCISDAYNELTSEQA